MNPQEMEMAVLKLSRQHQQYGSSQSKEKICAIPSLKKEYHEKQKGKFSLRSAHTRGLAPATSSCDKLRGQVPYCELAIVATKSSRRD